MFLEKPRQIQRSKPPPFAFSQRQQLQPMNRVGILSQFKTENGDFDLDKISNTAKQINDIYQEVSPMVKPIISKFLNKQSL